MSKLFLLLMLCPLLLININNNYKEAKGTSMNGYVVTYYSEVYEPVEPKSVVTVSGNIFIRSGTGRDNLRIRYDLYSPLKSGMSKSYSSGFISSTFSYPGERKLSYTFTINDSRTDYAREGITVRVGIYDNSSKQYVNYIDGHLYDKSEEDVDIDSLNGEVVYDRCLYLSDAKKVESFNFSNYSHLVEVDHYHRLDLSSLSFIYKSFKELSYEEAYITFKDEHDLFSDIEESEGKKKVPIKLINNNNVVSIGFDSLYVSGESLKMSTIKKTGYSKTSYFYLPKNKLSKLQGLAVTVHVNKLGVHKISFTYDCSIYIGSLFLGPCNLSEFCIVGGVEK